MGEGRLTGLVVSRRRNGSPWPLPRRYFCRILGLVGRHIKHFERGAITRDSLRIGTMPCKSTTSRTARASAPATGPNAIVVISGAPGSGKITTLAPIVEAWQAAGHRVIGTATAWRVARALQQDLNIEARATASWVERLKTGKRFLDEKSVLIVDEAGLLSSRETLALLSEVERAQAKVSRVAIAVNCRRSARVPASISSFAASRLRALTPSCASVTSGRDRP